jgi:hypothetical protein
MFLRPPLSELFDGIARALLWKMGFKRFPVLPSRLSLFSSPQREDLEWLFRSEVKENSCLSCSVVAPPRVTGTEQEEKEQNMLSISVYREL